MGSQRLNIKQWAILILILGCLGWHLALPINLVSSDLGRYVKNGELITQGHWDVLYKNFFSYTAPSYPFINYHWFFGVFCYAVWHYLGFIGLSSIYLFLELFTFYLFFRCWQRFSSFPMLCAFSLLSIPLVSLRSSIRPEGISYLFCGLFWYLIDAYQQKRLKSKYLILVLCVLQIIWVNTHIFFLMGPVLTAVLWWQARCNKEEVEVHVLQKLFCLLLAMCLINPFGVNVFSVIFDTWHKTSLFSVLETQSVFYFLGLRTLSDKSFCFYFLASVGMLITPMIFLIQKEGFKKYIFIGILVTLLGLVALKAVRMMGLWGYFWMPLSACLYTRWMREETVKTRKNIEIILLTAGILVSVSVNVDWKQQCGVGIVPGANEAADFFKREKIAGPIFNNYNIGGYLIFQLSPAYKLFIDDRGMAAYPEDFLKNTYMPIELSDDYWKKMDRRYRFNVIFYSPEVSYWRDRFIWSRFSDPAWALVFFREDVVIFLKRNQQNAALIRRFEIHLKVKSPTEIDILK